MGNCLAASRGTDVENTQNTSNSGGIGKWFKGQSKKSRTWDGVVQLPKPWKAEPPFGPLTETELKRMREEFWDTRTEGRQEMWQALKAAAETNDVSNKHNLGIGDIYEVCVCVYRQPCATKL